MRKIYVSFLFLGRVGLIFIALQPPFFVAPSSMPLPTTDDFMHADQAMTMECTYLRKKHRGQRTRCAWKHNMRYTSVLLFNP